MKQLRVMAILALSLSACAQISNPISTQLDASAPLGLATEFDPAGTPTSVGREPDEVRSLFPGTWALVRLCLFGIKPEGGKVVVPSPADYTEVTVDPTSLPKGISANKISIAAGTGCGFLRLDATMDATIGTATLKLTAATYTLAKPTMPTSIVRGNLFIEVHARGGALSVQIEGLPTGTVLKEGVTIRGPYGFSTSLGSEANFAEVPAGEYTIVSAPNEYRTSDSIVSTVFDNITAPAARKTTVTAGGTSKLIVTYAKRQGTGLLWTNILPVGARTPADWKIGAFAAPDLSRLNSTASKFAPTVEMNWLSRGDATYPSFSTNGTMWLPAINSSALHTISSFQPSKLATGTDTAAGLEFTMGSGTYQFMDLAFDRSGNLWTLTAGNGLMRFPAATLSRSADLTPDIWVKNVSDTRGFTFDLDGNIWVPGISKTSVMKLFKIPKSLGAGTHDAEKLENGIERLEIEAESVVSISGGLLESPTFDAFGYFWFEIHTTDMRTIVQIPTSDLVAGTKLDIKNYTQNRIYGSTTGNRSGLAFDNSGQLWTTVWSAAGSELWQLDVRGLALRIRTAHPVKRLSGFASFVGIAFNPPPCGLPLAGSQPC